MKTGTVSLRVLAPSGDRTIKTDHLPAQATYAEIVERAQGLAEEHPGSPVAVRHGLRPLFTLTAPVV